MQTKEATKALASSRTEIEKLIASTNTNDHFSLQILGQILADLRSAQNELQAMGTSPKTAKRPTRAQPTEDPFGRMARFGPERKAD